MPRHNPHPRRDHHQDLPIKNPAKRLRKKLRLVAGMILAVSHTLPESYFMYQGALHKRVDLGQDGSGAKVATVMLPAPEDSPFSCPIFIPSDAEVELIAA